MTGGPEDAGEGAVRGDPAALMRDWMTLMQTELAGLATDREALETWQALAGVWARGLGPHDPAGPKAVAAAPAAGGDAPGGDGVVAALLERIDALERRVAELEQRGRRPKRGGAG
jgi:hypothetical protein